MSRLPVISFAALVAATVGAFFVTQHLKVTTPLIAGAPAPYPGAINPLNGISCGGLDHRRTTISFYLLHRADDVDVYVVDQSGTIVRTVAQGRHMRRSIRIPDGVFTWDGKEDNGSLAPDGAYHFRVALIHQGRTVDISTKPITVKTVPPQPVVTRVSPSLIPQGRARVAIHYSGNERRGGTAQIYRTDVVGKPPLVKTFLTPWNGQTATWDGRIHQRPAPAGTYLVGLAVTDAACNTGRFPPVIPPPTGSTPHAGVTIRYLAAQPPLDPVAPGSHALVYVDSRHRPYRWSLSRAGARRPLVSGSSSRFSLRVPVPGGRAGLYELSIQLRSGTHSTTVPLIARAPRRTRILVVLPGLTWQGENLADDDGDGVPDTLDNGGPVELERPFAHGLPSGVAEEAALLSHLDSSHLPYDLTTDLGLIDGIGPGLSGHAGVVLPGSERWLPASVSAALRSYVGGGGRVLSLGIDSLRRGVSVQGAKALGPTQPSSADALGARTAGVVEHNRDLISVIVDGLGIFSTTSGAFQGYGSYQPIVSVAPPSQILSEAGTSASAPSIVGYRLGSGIVVDVGLPTFGSSLGRNVDAQELVSRLWSVLSR